MIFTPGVAIAAASGSIGGTTFSRNRGGPYTRTRAIPVNPSTSFQLNRRADLATLSQNWQGLTANERQSWENWASQNPRVNALGQTFSLTGAQAFVSLNAPIRADGGTLQDNAPIVPAPDAFTTVAQTYDLGITTFDFVFTPPLPSGTKISLWAAVVNSAGITYVKNLMRHIGMSPADQATPYTTDVITADRLGTLVVGQIVHYEYGVYDPATGLTSPMLKLSGAVVSTS